MCQGIAQVIFANHAWAGEQAIAELAPFSVMPGTGLDPIVLES